MCIDVLLVENHSKYERCNEMVIHKLVYISEDLITTMGAKDAQEALGMLRS